MPLSPALLLAAAALAATPRLASVGLRAGGGVSGEAGRTTRTRYGSGELSLGVDLSSVLELDLSYGLSQRQRRGVTHTAGAVGRFLVGGPFSVELSLFASPPGREDEAPLCVPLEGGLTCADSVRERLGFLSPGVSVQVESDDDDESPTDVEWAADAGAEATYYRLDYRVLSGRRAGQEAVAAVQDYRLGGGLSLTFRDRLTVGARGAVFLLGGEDSEALPRAEERAPTELPLAPVRYELGASLAFDFTPALRARVALGYASFRDPCFGDSREGSLRLTALPGRLRLYAQVGYARDVSPTDASTLEACELERPEQDYVSTSLGVGVDIAL